MIFWNSTCKFNPTSTWLTIRVWLNHFRMCLHVWSILWLYCYLFRLFLGYLSPKGQHHMVTKLPLFNIELSSSTIVSSLVSSSCRLSSCLHSQNMISCRLSSCIESQNIICLVYLWSHKLYLYDGNALFGQDLVWIVKNLLWMDCTYYNSKTTNGVKVTMTLKR